MNHHLITLAAALALSACSTTPRAGSVIAGTHVRRLPDYVAPYSIIQVPYDPVAAELSSINSTLRWQGIQNLYRQDQLWLNSLTQ